MLKQLNYATQSKQDMMQELQISSMTTQEFVNTLGYIEKGTGVHQSNLVYGTDGLCPCEYAGLWKEPFKVIECQKF